MTNILESASKIVFIMLAFTACVMAVTAKLPIDQFMLLATAAFTFYFSNKGETSVPFAGK